MNSQTGSGSHSLRFKILFFILILLALTACVPRDGASNADHPAGFFWGVWHGWIAPISLIISWFKPSLSIYEPYNTGFWYNFGFYISIIAGFGSLSLTRRKYKEKC